MGLGSLRSSHRDGTDHPQWNSWSFLAFGEGRGLVPLEWASLGPQDGSWRASHALSKTYTSLKGLGVRQHAEVKAP